MSTSTPLIVITNKLAALDIAHRTLQEAQESAVGLYGMYDARGKPTGVSQGSLETLVVTVISEVFDEEGVTDGPRSARDQSVKWLRDMAREAEAVADALERAPVAPDFREEEGLA